MLIATWICCVAAVAVVCAEWGARLWLRHRDAWFVWRPGSRIHMKTDPTVLPDMERLVRFEVNSQGERGSEPPADPAGTYRILVAGGSAAECYFLDQPSTWPEVMRAALERALPRRDASIRHVHVGNIGKSLVSTEHVDEVLRRIRRDRPKLDLLILMTGASNVANWLGKGAPTEIAELSAVPHGVFEVRPDGPFGWRRETCALAEVWRSWRAAHLRPIAVRERAGERLGRARAMRRRARDIRTDVPSPEVMVAHFERRFRDLLRQSREVAERVLVVRQPWFKKDAYSAEEIAAFWHGAAGNPYVGDVTTYYSVERVEQLVSMVDARVEAVSREQGVEQVDLMPHLSHTLETFYDFWHFTPQGAAVVGQVVADAVVSRVPSPAPPREPRDRPVEVASR